MAILSKPEKLFMGVIMDFELYYLGLPLIASVIGYSTNWIAVRMLFRPLEEKRLFGYRIPFTPGLIPKRKSEIAENIGEAVGEHLLTPEALEARLATPKVKRRLKSGVESWIESFLNKEMGSLKEIVPGETESDLEALTERIVGKLQGGLESVVSGEEFESLLRKLIAAGVEDLSEKELGEIVDRWSYEELTIKLEKILSRLANQEQLEENIRGFWKRKIAELKDSGKCVEEYLGEGITEFIIRQVEAYLPILLKRGAELLDRPELRSGLEKIVFDLIDEKIQGEFQEDSVWDQLKLGFLETLVLPRKDLKKKVEEMIEEGLPKLIDLLEQEEVRQEITSSAIDSLRKALRKDLSELGLFERKGERTADVLTELSTSLVQNDRVQTMMLDGLVIVLRNSENKKVGELTELRKEEEKEALVRALSSYVIDSLRSERVQNKLGSAVEERIQALRTKKIGKLSRWIDPELVTPFAGPLVDKLTVIMAQEGSNILNALNVKELVKGEVEEFSTLRVERLVLDVTGDQFRAITWFGALIGFLIGLLQILIITYGG